VLVIEAVPQTSRRGPKNERRIAARLLQASGRENASDGLRLSDFFPGVRQCPSGERDDVWWLILSHIDKIFREPWSFVFDCGSEVGVQNDVDERSLPTFRLEFLCEGIRVRSAPELADDETEPLKWPISKHEIVIIFQNGVYWGWSRFFEKETTQCCSKRISILKFFRPSAQMRFRAFCAGKSTIRGKLPKVADHADSLYVVYVRNDRNYR
jgi:hypothetical protein